jgi:hypothetical protein
MRQALYAPDEWGVTLKCAPERIKRGLPELYFFVRDLPGVQTVHFVTGNYDGFENSFNFRVKVEPKKSTSAISKIACKLEQHLAEGEYLVPGTWNMFEPYFACFPVDRISTLRHDEFAWFTSYLQRVTDLPRDEVSNSLVYIKTCLCPSIDQLLTVWVGICCLLEETGLGLSPKSTLSLRPKDYSFAVGDGSKMKRVWHRMPSFKREVFEISIRSSSDPPKTAKTLYNHYESLVAALYFAANCLEKCSYNSNGEDGFPMLLQGISHLEMFLEKYGLLMDYINSLFGPLGNPLLAQESGPKIRGE